MGEHAVTSDDDPDWRASIEALKEMAHHVEGLPTAVKHMIEQAWLASQQGQEAMARDLLAQAKRKMEG
tara:strand:+ start:472 stop:675 length:204 start_codon:yes stop_codon:yes gene_type:complete